MSTAAHNVTITHEHGRRSGALVTSGGHRGSCSCGWFSDCYAQLSDTERAIEVHLRRETGEDTAVCVRKSSAAAFKGLIERSSIGQALRDIRERGIDAHLVDLEREMRKPRRFLPEKPREKMSAKDKAFMRGFGVALASIWRCHHDAGMVRSLLKENGFTLTSFHGTQLLPADLAAIRQALGPRKRSA